jgi:UPF0716 family protein affecting phage T7 exclusion
MKLITLTTLLIVCVAINIAALIWIGYNVNPILTLTLIIGETWLVASLIKIESKQNNNNKGKLNF